MRRCPEGKGPVGRGPEARVPERQASGKQLRLSRRLGRTSLASLQRTPRSARASAPQPRETTARRSTTPWTAPPTTMAARRIAHRASAGRQRPPLQPASGWAQVPRPAGRRPVGRRPPLPACPAACPAHPPPPAPPPWRTCGPRERASSRCLPATTGRRPAPRSEPARGCRAPAPAAAPPPAS